MLLHIGLDDTDSPEGGCTTYVAALLAERLLAMGAEFTDYPTLLRLNPNTPWKTRGNASVCLRFNLDESRQGDAKRAVIDLVDSYGEFLCENTNPGAVFHVGEVPREAKEFSDRTVKQIVRLEDAEAIIDGCGIGAVGWKNRRGIIGALAAVGGALEGDHTYELLTYRSPEYWGEARKMDEESVREMDRVLGGVTFNNVDERGRPLIAPHGPDPVLYGVRGESAEAVYTASTIVRPLEPVERWMNYRSNQGTDAHLGPPVSIGDLRPYNPAVVEATVAGTPRTITGGHVIFRVADPSGEVDCAAYEPTGSLREVARGLIPGDRVRVHSGVRELEGGLTLNIEKLEVLGLAEDVELRNPRCPACGGPTESMGAGQGLRCKRCGHRGPMERTLQTRPRAIKVGVHLPDRDAHRHLTKPLERYGREQTYRPSPMFSPWIGWGGGPVPRSPSSSVL
ncbi:MAG TPA: tRNA(Ile)(2)-agmatinylcytidine synthase [Candidatus Bathyarchaeia archaeon]